MNMNETQQVMKKINNNVTDTNEYDNEHHF